MAANLEPPVTDSEVEVAAPKEVAPADNEPSEVPPLTVSPVVVALEKETLRAAKEPRDDPPLTVRPVVVALPKLVLPVTPRDPSDAPPVTVIDVEVPAPKVREPSDDPPLTVNPVVVAFCMFAPTPQLVEVAEMENIVEVPAWPLTWNKGRWRPRALSWMKKPFSPTEFKIIWGEEVAAL